MPRKKKDVVDWKDLPEGKDKYNAYMKSDEWKAVRLKVLDRDGNRCKCCGRTSDKETLSIHHSSYHILYHEDEGDNLDWLITLCKVCHSGIHRCKSNINRFKKPK